MISYLINLRLIEKILHLVRIKTIPMSRGLLLEKGWKRHSVIEASSDLGKKVKANSPEIIRNLLEVENALILITTYDCAVVHHCFKNEPWVQILVITPVELEKKYKNRRDPRILHFTVKSDSSEMSYQATASGFFQLERVILCDYNPSSKYEITDANSYELKIWVADRFRQETWSDEFNRAVQPAKKKLKRLHNRLKEYTTGIYIKLENNGEEMESEKYSISVLMLLEKGKSRKLLEYVRQKKKDKNISIDKAKETIVNEIVTAFGNTVDFIEDVTCHLNKAVYVESEENITIFQLREYKLFSPHTLSEFENDSELPIDIISQ